MKKSDIAMIILIASVCAFIAFLVAGQMPFLKPNPKGVKVPTTEKISSSVTQPSEDVFNKAAINPTVQTLIGNTPGAVR